MKRLWHLIERAFGRLMGDRFAPDMSEMRMRDNYEVWYGVRCWRCGELYDGNFDCECSRAHNPARRA